ncbi:hypothetical protein [Sinomonas sp.]|uniref:hypothetical protein n=1 Tax=Sinomonas sp. TaxID=1914986 RepID=UPI002FE084B5
MSDWPLSGTLAAHGMWRVAIDVRDLDDRPLHALRLLLVADVLRRAIEELQGGQVLLALLDSAAGPVPGRGVQAQALWIRAPSARTSSPTEAAAMLGGPPSLTLIPADPAPATAPLPEPGRTLRIASVEFPTRGTPAPSASDLLSDYDPLGLRLALLRFPYSSTAILTPARLHRAEETLHRWQYKVADWADTRWRFNTPDRPDAAPVPQDAVNAMHHALAADLDTGTVLRLLHRIETDLHLAAGRKFATFASLDRILALDLSHSVRRRHR